MAVPDVTRRWEFPPPDGDDWRFDFPFTLGKGDALGSCAYLHRVFSSYGEGSVGDFMTEGVDFHLEQGGAQPVYLLELMVWLAPYDLGGEPAGILAHFADRGHSGHLPHRDALAAHKRRCGKLAAAQYQLPQRAAQALLGLADDYARSAGGILD